MDDIPSVSPSGRRSLDAATAARFAHLALGCIHRHYPNQIAHVLLSEADVRPPHALTPAFSGCYDWHSAVHGHWCLARLSRLFPAADWTVAANLALGRSLTAENLQAELRYLNHPARSGFERPYGLAWLLQLAAELRERDDPAARQWLQHLQPLEVLAASRLTSWLPRLTHPIRSGEHSQTALAMGLHYDHAVVTGDDTSQAVCAETALRFYAADEYLPISFEPSGHDFLSPALAEADLLRRVLPKNEFSTWLERAMPQGFSLPPAVSPDPADGKLAHLDGLNLSRAWMLDGIAAALEESDPRRAALRQQADTHAKAGLASVTGDHYAGGHWLGTFAAYLMTNRGVGSR